MVVLVSRYEAGAMVGWRASVRDRRNVEIHLLPTKKQS
jgi:hypothetical protein